MHDFSASTVLLPYCCKDSTPDAAQWLWETRHNYQPIPKATYGCPLSHASKSRVRPKTDRHDGRTYITLHRPRDREYHSFFEIQHTILGKIGGRSKKWSACFELTRFMEIHGNGPTARQIRTSIWRFDAGSMNLYHQQQS